jgi:hypothetical protein
MTSPEDRLRDALRAAGESVQAGTVRELPDAGAWPGGGRAARRRAVRLGRPGWRPARLGRRPGGLRGPGERISGRGPARGRDRTVRGDGAKRRDEGGRERRSPVTVPVAAAAAVAAVLAAAAIVVPHVWSGRDAAPPAQNPVSGTAGAPRYFAAVMYDTRPSVPGATVLEIFRSATGRIVGRVTVPRAGLYFEGVTALGKDGTFVAAAEPLKPTARDCVTWLYRFRVTAQGRPVDLRPLRQARVPAVIQPYGLTASDDGRVLAFDAAGCAAGDSGLSPRAGRLSVVSVATGAGRSWPWQGDLDPHDLSLSADGQLLSFVAADGLDAQLSQTRYADWLLRTHAAPGPLGQRSHQVIAPSARLVSTSLNRSGSGLAAVTMVTGTKEYRLQIVAYQVTGGRPYRVLKVLPVIPLKPALYFPANLIGLVSAGSIVSADSSGRYLLVYGWETNTYVFDLKQLRFSMVPVPEPVAIGGALSAAW